MQSLFEVYRLTDGGDQSGCPWHFALTVKTLECVMQLHVATEEEVNHWVKILSLLIEMRQQNISFKSVNPF